MCVCMCMCVRACVCVCACVCACMFVCLFVALVTNYDVDPLEALRHVNTLASCSVICPFFLICTVASM